jgi:hypothetical protein
MGKQITANKCTVLYKEEATHLVLGNARCAKLSDSV